MMIQSMLIVSLLGHNPMLHRTIMYTDVQCTNNNSNLLLHVHVTLFKQLLLHVVLYHFFITKSNEVIHDVCLTYTH